MLVIVAFFTFLHLISGLENVRLYTDVSNVKVAVNDHAVLAWKVNDTSNNGSRNISCYVIEQNKTINVGKWLNGSFKLDDDTKEKFSDRITGSEKINSVNLSILNASFEDSGQYFCQYKNMTRRIILTVNGGPIILYRQLKNVVERTHATTFELIACGKPKPIVQWQVFGESVNSTGQKLNDSMISKLKLKTGTEFCYSYVYSLNVQSRDICNASLRYSVYGYQEILTNQHYFRLISRPDVLSSVQTVREKGDCLLTTWQGPVLSPSLCVEPIRYQVIVTLVDQSHILFTTFSTSYLICEKNLNIDHVQDIQVSYSNLLGNGTFALSKFADKFNSNENEDNVVTIALGCAFGVLLLGVIIVIALLLIRYFCRMRKITTKKNGIQKHNIVPKPRRLSEVTGKANILSKSQTFNGTCHPNRYTDEPTLRKGFMPLNTLQKRITESLGGNDVVTNYHTSDFPLDNTSEKNERPVSTFTEISFTGSQFDDLKSMSSQTSGLSEFNTPRMRPRLQNNVTFEEIDRIKRSRTFSAAAKKLPSSEPLPPKRHNKLYDLPRAIQKTIKASANQSDMPSADQVIYVNSRPTSRVSSISSELSFIMNDGDKPLEIFDDDSAFKEKPVSHYDSPLSCYDTLPSSTPRKVHKSPRLSTSDDDDTPLDLTCGTDQAKVEKSNSVHLYATVKSLLNSVHEFESNKNNNKSTSDLTSKNMSTETTSENLSTTSEYYDDRPQIAEGVYADIYKMFHKEPEIYEV